ncbi:MAG TPA: T9SS type A sorting domain-containing protein [Chitinophagales bacterium]|nr:T9SS type A sorting domain-containing protein [Chitinophagales bacterium]
MRIFFLCLFCFTCNLSISQQPSGRLYFFTAPGGIPPPYAGFIQYPEMSIHHIDDVQLLDFAVKGDKLFAGTLQGVIIYDTANYQPLDTIQVSYPRHLAAWGENLVVTSASKPHFRVYDNSHTLLFSLDSAILPIEPFGIGVTGNHAFLLLSNSILIVDLIAEDTIATVTTPHPFPFGGYNYFLTDAGDDFYIDVEYATGALRFSMMRINKATLVADTVFHREGYSNYTPPVAARDKIYLLAFDSHYDITNDSLHISANQGNPLTVEYDKVSTALFLSNHGNEVVYLLDGTFSDTVSITGNLERALFIPDEADTVNWINDKRTAEVSVYPNPVLNVLYVLIPKLSRISRVQLFDAAFRMLECKIADPFARKIEINCTRLPQGFYYLKFLTPDGVLFSRFCKVNNNDQY